MDINLTSLELTTPPTAVEILQLRRHAYVAAHLHWVQTRGYNPDSWDAAGRDEHRRAKYYARHMSDLSVQVLLEEYR